MKKTKLLFVFAMIFTILISACSGGADDTLSKKQVERSDCSILYFPILADTVWTYQIEIEDGSFIKSNIQYADFTDNSFMRKQEIPGVTPIVSEVKWNCSEEGLISTEFGSMSITGIPSDFQFETLEFSGITYPPDDKWEVGTEWTGKWTIRGQMEIEDFGLTNADIDVIMNNIIIGEESISVVAGVYEDAIRVDSTMNFVLNYNVEGTDLPTVNAEFTMTSWYVKNVGLVKQVSEENDSLMELESLK